MKDAGLEKNPTEKYVNEYFLTNEPYVKMSSVRIEF